MKKRVFFISLLVFLISLGTGFYLTRSQGEKTQEEVVATEEADVLTTIKKEITLQKTGTLVYQYFYTKDRITKEQTEPMPNYLVGLTRQQLQEIYKDWQIVYFSPENTILRINIEGGSGEVYLLTNYSGYVTIFHEDENKKMRLQEQTTIPISTLPEKEQAELEDGIYLIGEEALSKLLADYVS